MFLIPGAQLIMPLGIGPGLLRRTVGAGTVGIVIHPRARDRLAGDGVGDGAADHERRRRLADLLLDRLARCRALLNAGTTMASRIAPTGIARTSSTAATITAATFHAPPPLAGRAGSSRGMGMPLAKSLAHLPLAEHHQRPNPNRQADQVTGGDQNRQNSAGYGQAVRLRAVSSSAPQPA